ncbi:MAG: nitronate monooxygenase [Deltaproteobacteria bacterium]|nr:nitronate monooxygenase [Deltaproteobacteria bacterium]
MTRIETPLTRHVGTEVPIICGAMYPCSNPELIAAVSKAGAVGIIQPISMSFVHGVDLRAGIRRIRAITDKPIGFNAIVEKTSKIYEERMRAWVDIALEEGVRFFVTALGKPRWVVEKVHAAGGIVYHDVTERRWAERALEEGVDGLICVNDRAGGHAGRLTPRALYESMADLKVPLVCAGGIGDERAFIEALSMGYAGVQMGTRFIATTECNAHEDYKRAIVQARAEDIVLTEKLSGVPAAVIKTRHVERMGTKAGFVAKRLLRHPRAKHWMRTYYAVKSIWQLKRASIKGTAYKDYFQAGKSVAGIHGVEPVGEIIRRFANAASQDRAPCAERIGASH